MSYPYVYTNNGVTVYIDGKPRTISRSHGNYDGVIQAIKNDDWSAVATLVDGAKIVVKYTDGHVRIDNGMVMYKDRPLSNNITRKILAMYSEGFNVNPMLRFLENMMDNPSFTAVQELYLFLESGHFPITEDGHFLAYKAVNKDFKDIHSKTVDNSVGQKPWMPRNEVDDNRNNECSSGYHFCSLPYLKNFAEDDGYIVVVKINPADVVAIPRDYNNTKGRCWQYEVIAVHSQGKGELNKLFTESHVYVESKPVVEEKAVVEPVKPVVEEKAVVKTPISKTLNLTNAQIHVLDILDGHPHSSFIDLNTSGQTIRKLVELGLIMSLKTSSGTVYKLTPAGEKYLECDDDGDGESDESVITEPYTGIDANSLTPAQANVLGILSRARDWCNYMNLYTNSQTLNFLVRNGLVSVHSFGDGSASTYKITADGQKLFDNR